MISPIIVVGSGRCGSSAVARTLHEELGVDMGGRGNINRKESPEGDYEDPVVRIIDDSRITGNIDKVMWREALLQYAYPHVWKWGFKHPANFQYLLELSDIFPEALFIWADRNAVDTADSFHRHYGRDPISCMNTVNRRRRVIKNSLDKSDVMWETIVMDRHWPTADLAAVLSKMIERWTNDS